MQPASVVTPKLKFSDCSDVGVSSLNTSETLGHGHPSLPPAGGSDECCPNRSKTTNALMRRRTGGGFGDNRSVFS